MSELHQSEIPSNIMAMLETVEYAEVYLDERAWEQYLEFKKNQGFRGDHISNVYVGRFDGKDYPIHPGKPISVPLHVAEHLVKNSYFTPLKRSPRGEVLMEQDKNAEREPMLVIGRTTKPKIIFEGDLQQPKMAAFRCPYTGQEFDDAEAFKAHMERQRVKALTAEKKGFPVKSAKLDEE